MKKLSNPRPTEYDYCIIESTPYAMLHEIFFGNPGARLSQDHGLQVRLSRKYHQDSGTGIHGGNRELDCVLKVKACKKWMERENKTEKDFYDIFRIMGIGAYEEYEYGKYVYDSDYWMYDFDLLPSKVADRS